MPLRSLAIQRAQVGGKKPSFVETMKLRSGKDPKQSMLNAEHLLAKDPMNGEYAATVLRYATKAGNLETCKWVAPIAMDTLRKEKKPNKNRFAAYRQALVDAAGQADQRGDSPLETWLLEQAVNSLDYLAARLPGDEAIRDELRDLAGRLTISRGKYDEAEDFRDSLRDADTQKRLHDSERLLQGDDTMEALIESARKEYEAQPEVAGKVYAYADVLAKTERKELEDQAIEVLLKTYESTRNYSFKQRADDYRLRQLNRETSKVVARARQSGTEEDRQQARLAAMEQRQVVLDVYRERAAKYPTDLRIKYKLGQALFETGELDEAIPVLQAAQQDPRTRSRSQLMLGRAFFEKGSPGQAIEVLREALEKYELDDDHSKEMLYWLGRSCEASERMDEARDAFGKLLRQDYNYKDGDARKRLEGLK